MPYRIAGIDVHKRVLAVVVSDVEIEREFQFERRVFGSNPEQLRSLAAWLVEQRAEEVVMESTAQYWKPVWGALERYWKPMREKREGRKIVTGTQVGTFTVNCDGSGQIIKTTTTSTGVVSTSTDDFVITAAKRIHGQLIATAIEDAQGIPSAIVPGGVFVIHHLTRLPDSGGSDGDQDQQ